MVIEKKKKQGKCEGSWLKFLYQTPSKIFSLNYLLI